LPFTGRILAETDGDSMKGRRMSLLARDAE